MFFKKVFPDGRMCGSDNCGRDRPGFGGVKQSSAFQRSHPGVPDPAATQRRCSVLGLGLPPLSSLAGGRSTWLLKTMTQALSAKQPKPSAAAG